MQKYIDTKYGEKIPNAIYNIIIQYGMIEDFNSINNDGYDFKSAFGMIYEIFYNRYDYIKRFINSKSRYTMYDTSTDYNEIFTFKYYKTIINKKYCNIEFTEANVEEYNKYMQDYTNILELEKKYIAYIESYNFVCNHFIDYIKDKCSRIDRCVSDIYFIISNDYKYIIIEIEVSDYNIIGGSFCGWPGFIEVTFEKKDNEYTCICDKKYPIDSDWAHKQNCVTIEQYTV